MTDKKNEMITKISKKKVTPAQYFEIYNNCIKIISGSFGSLRGHNPSNYERSLFRSFKTVTKCHDRKIRDEKFEQNSKQDKKRSSAK